MDDMNAFERQVAGEFVRRAGPVRPVDAAAIFTVITATQSPKWRFQSMFSATKFVVAGAIVALFGGILLSGVLYQPNDGSVPAAVSPGTAEPETTADDERPTTVPNVTPEREPLGADLSRGVFTSAGTLEEPRGSHDATLLPDGRVLVVGGWREDFSGEVTSAEIWDPETGTFAPAGSVADGGQAPTTTTLLADGRVLVVSGSERMLDTGQRPPEAEVWDPVSMSFSSAGLPAGRLGHTATGLPDGRVLLVGGNHWDNDRSTFGSPAEVWDPSTLSFGPAGALTETRWDHTATLLPDGRVLVVGGSATTRGSGPTLSSAEVWDPATESFQLTGVLAEARWGHTATLLSDGRVLVVGGFGDSECNGCGWKNVRAAEAWDPETNSFSPAGSLIQARTSHTATLLRDGQVLVVGGGGRNNRPRASTEVWDPATATFQRDGVLAEARTGHTATLLPDGRVLIVGGGNNDQRVVSAEVWSSVADGLTAESETATTPDFLPGVDLVTEEVEPEVYRVLSDRIRDLSGQIHEVIVTPEWDGATLSLAEPAIPRGESTLPATAPDGSASTVIDNQLYVITPEAVEAKG